VGGGGDKDNIGEPVIDPWQGMMDPTEKMQQ
jgi:hypothetical protein